MCVLVMSGGASFIVLLSSIIYCIQLDMGSSHNDPGYRNSVEFACTSISM